MRATRAPVGSRASSTPPAVSFRTWRVRNPSARTVGITPRGGRGPVRRHVVRTHTHTYLTGPGRSERVTRLVWAYTRGGAATARHSSDDHLTVFVLRP